MWFFNITTINTTTTVIAIDIDPVKIEYARHNAKVIQIGPKILLVIIYIIFYFF